MENTCYPNALFGIRHTLAGFDSHLSRTQIYYYKANGITDITMHKVTNYFSSYLLTILKE